MKKKKLNLKQLKVKSFVTSLKEDKRENTIKGGQVTRGGEYTCENTVRAVSDCDWC